MFNSSIYLFLQSYTGSCEKHIFLYVRHYTPINTFTSFLIIIIIYLAVLVLDRLWSLTVVVGKKLLLERM